MSAQAEAFRLTATQARSKLRDGSLTVVQYAQSLLARIEERDPIVKGWAYINPKLVLEEASKLDQVPLENRGPLHGIAVGVKDVIYTKGLPTQHNSSVYRDDQPELDAASIRILRQAGALVLGKTTTTEFAATLIGPPTCNPHDPSRTPGGSSSGSGAVVGDMQVPIALGTQTGGSTIRPGSFNGVYAMKPTWSAISREGQILYSAILDTLGLYARSVEDLEMLADAFAVADDKTPDDKFELVNAKVAFCKTMNWSSAGPGTKAAMDKAFELLAEHGAEVEEIEFPAELQELPQWHRTIMKGDGRVTFLADYRRAKGQLDQLIMDHVEDAWNVSRSDYLEAFDNVAAARPKVDRLLSNFAAVVVPSVPDEAPLGIKSTGASAFNGIWTALHNPVINVPGFKGSNGMPIGVSLVAPRHKDRHLLKVAETVGRIFESDGGWKSEL